MSILKLANAGEEATLTIAACNIVEGQYGAQVRFDTGDDVTLYLPQSSADRQLERIGLDYGQTIGETLTFSRTASTKPGSKPFWNISKANGAKKAPPPEERPTPFANKPEAELPEFLRDASAEDARELAAKVSDHSDPRKAKQEAYAAAQYQSVKIALDVLVPLFEAKEIGVSDDVVHKLSYELFRTWTDKGLVG